MSTQSQRLDETEVPSSAAAITEPPHATETEPRPVSEHGVGEHDEPADEGGGRQSRADPADPTDPTGPSHPTSPRNTTLGFANEVVVPSRRHVIDRFDNAAGLFLLRLAAAAVMGVHGVQKVQDQAATGQQVRALQIPAPDTVAMLFGPIEIAIAVALVLGLAVRAAGLGTAIVAIGALVLVRWTSPDTIFDAHQPGFTGETELLLAGIGLMLLGVGGGGWGLDHKVRNRRRA